MLPWQAVLDDLEEKLQKLKDKRNTISKRCGLRIVMLIIDYDWLIFRCCLLLVSIFFSIQNDDFFNVFDFNFLLHLLSSKSYIVERILGYFQT